MDNKTFNVRGRSLEELTLAIKLCLMIDSYGKEDRIKGWYFDPKHGLIALWSIDSNNKNHKELPMAMGAEMFAPIAYAWIHSSEAKKIKLSGWDEDTDHDGSNDLGWRLYLEDWGHIGNERYGLFALIPSYCWYGK